MGLQAIIGSTIYLEFSFFDRVDGVTPAAITEPIITVYDSNRAVIGTSVELTNANKISEGKYFYYLTIPDKAPFIDVEMSVLNADMSDVKRERITLVWSEEDVDDIPQISITVGTDSYISLEDANTYFSRKLDVDVWDNSSDTDKIKALIQATVIIDSLNLIGQMYDYNQILQFPRVYKYVPRQDIKLLVNQVPTAVINACCEEALGVLESRNNPLADIRADAQAQGVKRIKNGDSEEEYTGQGAGKKLFSDEALTLLKPYIQNIITIGEWY